MLDWALKLAPIAISLVGLVIAIGAYRRSGKIAKINIPAPVIAAASKNSVSVVMGGDTGKRYGIAELCTSHPVLRLYETVENDGYGSHPTYKPVEGEKSVTKITAVPPITVIVIRHPVVLGSVVRVKVVSRGDDGLSSWFSLPVF